MPREFKPCIFPGIVSVLFMQKKWVGRVFGILESPVCSKITSFFGYSTLMHDNSNWPPGISLQIHAMSGTVRGLKPKLAPCAASPTIQVTMGLQVF